MNTSKKFQRKKEDFVCIKCKIKVKGDGYTNHCPECLWSKHVDLNPGDRESCCQGLMKPKSVLQKDGKYSLVHVCQKCDLEKKNKVSKNDNFEKVIELSREEEK